MNAILSNIRDVVAATDIVALIGIDIELKKTGIDYTARCPFHDEKTPSFTVSADKQFYHCFGCGAHGDALAWMRDYHKLPFRAALEALAGQAGLDLIQENNGALRARRTKAATRELESALTHELMVLNSAVSARVAYRQIPKADLDRYPHIQPVPDDPWEREYEAAQRIAKALYALYGVRV